MQPVQPGPFYAPQSGPSSLLLLPLNVAHYRLASASHLPSPFVATPLSLNPYQADFMANSISSTSYLPSLASLNSSIDLGSVEESSDGASHISKQPRTSYGYSRRASRSLSRAPSQPELPWWSSATQARFASLMAHITASCGFPFLWVENLEWISFCNEFVPGAQPIS